MTYPHNWSEAGKADEYDKFKKEMKEKNMVHKKTDDWDNYSSEQKLKYLMNPEHWILKEKKM